MTSDLDELLATTTPEPTTSVTTVTPRKCKRHLWVLIEWSERPTFTGRGWYCDRCDAKRDDTKSRRGKQSRNYGNRAELDVARRYGGEKVGHHGGPVDVRGKDWAPQVKTHRRRPPAEWVKVFGKLEATTDRLPRLLLRFVQGPGLPPVDFVIVPGKAWLDWFGKDEDAA